MRPLPTAWLPNGSARLGRLLIQLVVAGVVAGSICVMGPATARAEAGETNEKSLPWYVPSHAKLQYAGNVGWLSAGAGYTYLNEILQTELSFGYVPAFTGSDRLFMATLKQLAIPYEFDLAERVQLVPVYGGVFATYTFGSDYYVFPPEHLEGVYSRQTALRFGPLVGGRVSADIEPFGPIGNVGAYWELSANDLALNAYFNNLEFFSFYDVLALGLGVEVGFE